MSKDDLGDRMKGYESLETGRRLDQSKPIYARIDGRGFSKFTRGMRRPFDNRMSEAMHAATIRLVADTRARLGYTQSDEISLIWDGRETEHGQQMLFDGKVQKLVSILSGIATAAFTRAILDSEYEGFRAYAERTPHFDCRVFNLPSREEGANAFLWRELDATRNAVSMTAQDLFSHNQLQGIGTRTMQVMIHNRGVDFNRMPAYFTRGAYFRRVTEERWLSDEELARIPVDHRPPGPVLRSLVRQVDMPPLLEVQNRVGVVFDGEEPQVAQRHDLRMMSAA